ncbi:MAG: hypothetical protein LUG13_07805 [Oscillospiraceae bacterium]|nr:hypothetical protein [Oscillospiraceae bacterium]
MQKQRTAQLSRQIKRAPLLDAVMPALSAATQKTVWPAAFGACFLLLVYTFLNCCVRIRFFPENKTSKDG